jgi:hypothetical protein
MAKLTAKKMQAYLNELEAQGNDLSAITINFRADRDSDVLQANAVEEDLFDSETNKVLESIVLISDTREV